MISHSPVSSAMRSPLWSSIDSTSFSIGYSVSVPMLSRRVEIDGLSARRFQAWSGGRQQRDCIVADPIGPTPGTPNAGRRTPGDAVRSWRLRYLKRGLELPSVGQKEVLLTASRRILT